MTEIKLEFDSAAVCRICLQSSDEEMISIYERDRSEKPILICEKIEKCGGIKVIARPELPSQICTKCNAFLNLAYKFRTICKHSDTYLREFVCKTTTTTASNNGKTTVTVAPTVKDVNSDYEIDEENVYYLDDSYQDERTVSSAESPTVMLAHDVQQQQQDIPNETITDECDEVEYEELQDYGEVSTWDRELDDNANDDVNDDDTNDDDADSEQFIIEDMNATDADISNTWSMQSPSEKSPPLKRIYQESNIKPTTISSRRVKLTSLASPQMAALAAARTNNSKTVKLPTMPTLSTLSTTKTTTKRKTLGISSDGAAVIRERSERISSNSNSNFPSSKVQLHICEICGNTYPRKYALDVHMRWHNNVKPYECE